MDRQVGGAHYKSAAIQPTEFAERNGLTFLEGCVVKRVLRHSRGGKGREDIEKAIHELEQILELHYPVQVTPEVPEGFPPLHTRVRLTGPTERAKGRTGTVEIIDIPQGLIGVRMDDVNSVLFMGPQHVEVVETVREAIWVGDRVRIISTGHDHRRVGVVEGIDGVTATVRCSPEYAPKYHVGRLVRV